MQARICVAVLVWLCCLVAPADRAAGVGLILLITGSWILICMPRPRILAAGLVTGAIAFGPYFAFVPILGKGQLVVAWSIFIKGLSSLVISICAACSMSLTELWQGLFSLAIPRLVAMILLQIIHQAFAMWDQTIQIGRAIAVRACTSGLGLLWRILSGLASVWLPGIVQKADRVAAAMELRGFCRASELPIDRVRLTVIDLAAIVISIALLVTAVVLRVLTSS